MPALAARRALIFGSPAVAELISRSLHELGFDSQLAGPSRLPSPTDPNAPADLRRILHEFKAAASGRKSIRHYLHPGTSVWAERQELPALAQEMGFELIGPPARVLAAFTDRLTWLTEAAGRGIPNLVLSAEPMHSIREIERFVEREAVRFPFVLRSVRSGGHLGSFVVYHPDDFKHRLPLWIEQHRLNLGEVILFAERHLEAGRRITVPFCRFGDGQVEIFPTLDSSLQSRFRKAIEFCPAESLDEDMVEKLEEWTAELALASGFVGVGAFEFLVESGTRAFVTDGTARLTTGYRLWERVAGTSAVAWQLAALETIPGLSPDDPPDLLPSKDSTGEWSFGVSLRIMAEDPLLHLPQPGLLKEVSHPRSWKLAGASAELVLGTRAGHVAQSDPLALLFVGGTDRKRALTVARGVLEELWFAGGLQTNERFLLELISHPWVKEGIFHAAFVDEEFIPALRPPQEVFRAAVGLVESLSGGPGDWIIGDQRAQGAKAGAVARWALGPEKFEVEGTTGLSGTLVLEDGRKVRACAFPVDPQRWLLRIGAWVLPVRNSSPGILRISALASGRVHAILFREGGRVPAHEAAIVLEASGRLIAHALPRDVLIRRWHVAAEQEVRSGDLLAELANPTKA